MLGDNPKRPPEKGDGLALQVKHIFKTLQGEGPNVGVPAIFIRLGGCNLACSFCDTEFEDYQPMELVYIIKNTEELSLNNHQQRVINLVVITGGEPLRQQISPLCKKLLSLGYKVQIETNGTIYSDIPQEVEIICSPKVSGKKYLSVQKDLLPRITAFKFLISSNVAGYSSVPELGQGVYNIPIYIQAMDQQDPKLNLANKKMAVDLVINNGYRLSYQIHKELGIE